MNEDELKIIIERGECETVEFKSSFNHETILSLNAFANTKGGSVFVGVKNDGTIVGVSTNKETLSHWINEIKSKTEPSLIPEATELTLEDKTVVTLSVKEFPVKPVSFQGRYYYKRIKNSNHPLRSRFGHRFVHAVAADFVGCLSLS